MKAAIAGYGVEENTFFIQNVTLLERPALRHLGEHDFKDVCIASAIVEAL